MTLLTFLVIWPIASGIFAYIIRKNSGVAGFSVIACAIHLLLALALLGQVVQNGPVATAVGSWSAPFGIAFAADVLSALMVVVTAIMSLATMIYSQRDIDEESRRKGFHFFYQLLIAGITGAFITADLFNLYVWFEVMLIASFALLVLKRTQSILRAALSYVTLNLFSTIVFLSAVGLMYSLTGTLNFADLNAKTPSVEDTQTLDLVVLLLSIAFAIKAALFPLYFWLPTSYHTPHPAVSAIFAALLTKVGVYALFRLYGVMVPMQPAYQEILLFWAWTTMGFGVIGAAAQSDVRKILSFHIVSQIGYMILGLALWTPLALAGAIFYLVHHILVKGNLFLIAGVIEQRCRTGELPRIGGLYKAAPLLSVLFLIPAFSLAGFPPLSGFWAKFLLVQAAVAEQYYWTVFVALAVGILTIYSMTKIWAGAFWKNHPTSSVLPTQSAQASLIPIAALAFLTVAIGLVPSVLFDWAETAANQVLVPETYVRAILGDS